jgi:predicted oxidoreductase
MEKIYLSDAGPKVSKAIYSLWRWEKDKELAKQNADKIIDLCIELGIDTFEMSASNHNVDLQNLFFGKLNEKGIDRENIVLFAKFGSSENDDFPLIDHSKSTLLGNLDKFLTNNHLDYLDMFLLDGYDYISDVEEVASTLEYIVHTGKAKFVGVSNVNSFQYNLLRKHLHVPIVTSHLELSLLKSEALFDGRLETIKESFSKPLAWAPLAGGEILEGGSELAIKIRNALNKIAKNHESNVEQIAVSWLMNLGVLPIIGSMNTNRIKNAALATDIKLNHQEWYSVMQLVQGSK